MSDELVDVAQPDQGQGDGGTTGDSPWSGLVNRIPEDLRDEANTFFKEREADFTRRSQEHASYRQQWEPYQQAGIHEMGPEAAQWAKSFYEALDNPQAIQEWFQGYAQQHGLQTQAPEPEPDFNELGGYEDPSALFEKLLEQKLAPLLQQQQAYDQRWQQLEQGAREAQLQDLFASQVAELKAKHPDRFDDKTEEALAVIAEAYKDDPQNAVPKAWATLEGILNHNERQALQRKASLSGGGGEPGGLPDGNPPEIKTLAQAGPAALEALRALRQQ